MNYWTLSPDNIYVAAHRGWSSRYPENTMEAFRAALSLNVDQLETDVRITRDGELVLIHDVKVDRTTNGTGPVSDYTLAELKQLDAGSWKGPEFTGCRIPTLLEFMELVKDVPGITLDIELKEYPTEGREELSYSVARRVLSIIDQYNFTDRIVINTFSGKLHEFLEDTYQKRYRRHIYFPQHYMSDCSRDPYTDSAYCCCMFGGTRMASKEDFDWMLRRGIQPWAGAGVKDAEGVDEAIACGAYLITCNNPDEILNLLRERGKHQ